MATNSRCIPPTIRTQDLECGGDDDISDENRSVLTPPTSSGQTIMAKQIALDVATPLTPADVIVRVMMCRCGREGKLLKRHVKNNT